MGQLSNWKTICSKSCSWLFSIHKLFKWVRCWKESLNLFFSLFSCVHFICLELKPLFQQNFLVETNSFSKSFSQRIFYWKFDVTEIGVEKQPFDTARILTIRWIFDTVNYMSFDVFCVLFCHITLNINRFHSRYQSQNKLK